MSQTSDCPVNKSVVLSFDAKEGQQSTFPLESNLDVLITSMLKGINNEYTKPISVVPAGEMKDVPSIFVKLNTPDAVIIPPGSTGEQPLLKSSGSFLPGVPTPTLPSDLLPGVPTPTLPGSLLPGVPTPVNSGAILSGVPSPAPFNPAPISAPPAELVTPNQPPANVSSPSPLAPSQIITERFGNKDRSIERSYLISKIIGILFLILIGYLILVKLEFIRY